MGAERATSGDQMTTCSLNRLSVLAAICALVFCRNAVAQDAGAATSDPEVVAAQEIQNTEPIGPLEFSELKPITEREILELIPVLAAPGYMDRESAKSRLLELGPVAYTPLRDAYVATDDFEVLLLIEQIVYATYVDYHVYSQKGFLGVGIYPYRPADAKDVPLPEGAPAVRLTTIHPNSAAERAGLEQNDVVVAMNGVPLEPDEEVLDNKSRRRGRNPLVRHFSKRIASHRPFETVSISAYRGAELLEFEVTLGKPPEDLVRRGNIQVVNEALVEAEKRFSDWWDHHFRAPRAKAVAAVP